MKSILSCVVLMTFLVTQPMQAIATETPVKVLNAFASKYPNAEDVNWSKSESHYIADFFDEKDAFFKEVTFDKEGTWIVTVSDIDEIDLPDETQNYLSAKVNDLDMLESIEREERPDATIYRVFLETEGSMIELIFDKNGNFIKEE